MFLSQRKSMIGIYQLPATHPRHLCNCLALPYRRAACRIIKGFADCVARSGLMMAARAVSLHCTHCRPLPTTTRPHDATLRDSALCSALQRNAALRHYATHRTTFAPCVRALQLQLRTPLGSALRFRTLRKSAGGNRARSCQMPKLILYRTLS